MKYEDIVAAVREETGLPDVTEVRRIIVGHGQVDAGEECCLLCRRLFDNAGQHMLCLVLKGLPTVWSKFLCADRLACRERTKKAEKEVELAYIV